MNTKALNGRRLYLLLIITAFAPTLSAQKYNISGDTVYVNDVVEVRIRFPSLPSSFYTAPTNAPYNFKTIGKGFTITAKMNNTKPATLFVTEGNRNHRFVLVYRKNIDYNNEDAIDRDYSSKKKLKNHVKEMGQRNP